MAKVKLSERDLKMLKKIYDCTPGLLIAPYNLPALDVLSEKKLWQLIEKDMLSAKYAQGHGYYYRRTRLGKKTLKQAGL